jgi:hypothetical protein
MAAALTDPAKPSAGIAALMWALVAAPPALMLLLWAAKRYTPRLSVSTGLLVASYALLIPGLACRIFEYRISGMGGSMEIRHKAETMGGFAVSLATEGGVGWLGAFMVVLYAMIIPAFKLALFVAAQRWRHGTSEQVRWARRFVITLKAISKWASPDIFAYVLLIHLVRGLSQDVDFFGMTIHALTGVGELRLGFTGFATFCVFSTIATLGLRTPAEPQDARETWRMFAAKSDSGHGLPSGKRALALVCSLFVAFAILLCVGLQVPCMALRLNMDALYEPNGPVSLDMKVHIDNMHLSEKTASDVSMLSCLTRLFSHATHGGSPNEIIAMVLYAVFVIVFSALDMILLVIAAIQQNTRILGAVEERGSPGFNVLRASGALKKLSMLDVALVGIFLVVICGSVYKKAGTALYFRPGFFLLLGAEACHYLAYFVVSGAAAGAAQPEQEEEARQVNAIEEGQQQEEVQEANVIDDDEEVPPEATTGPVLLGNQAAAIKGGASKGLPMEDLSGSEAEDSRSAQGNLHQV